MVKGNRILIFIFGFLCSLVLFSVVGKKAVCQHALSQNILFSAESNSMYFLDRDEARIYRYNTQGKITRIYIIKELGKDLAFK